MIWELAIGGTLISGLSALGAWCMMQGKLRADAENYKILLDSEYHRGLERGRQEARGRVRGGFGA